MLLGFWSLFLSPRRIQRAALILRPSTLLRYHAALKKRKYRLLFSSRRKGTPGPKGPSQELIRAIIELKQRNPRFGCPRIALIVAKTFGVEINKDVVRRVLATHYRPGFGSLGGHTPAEVSGERVNRQATLHRFRWQTHCRELYQLPVAA